MCIKNLFKALDLVNAKIKETIQENVRESLTTKILAKTLIYTAKIDILESIIQKQRDKLCEIK